MTKDECKKLLRKVGFKLGVSPRLIATRLLSDLDKIDMEEGVLPIASLMAHTEVWLISGMPDYVNEQQEPREQNHFPGATKMVEG